MNPATLDEIAPAARPADFNKIGHERRDAHAVPALKVVELQKDSNPNLTVVHYAGESRVREIDSFVLGDRRDLVELMDPVEALGLGVVYGANKAVAQMTSGLPGAKHAAH